MKLERAEAKLTRSANGSRLALSAIAAWSGPHVTDDRLKNGAGEGIRTLDPNLGKVVLYP